MSDWRLLLLFLLLLDVLMMAVVDLLVELFVFLVFVEEFIRLVVGVMVT